MVAARTLSDGVAWCEATFCVVPEPGGTHAMMSTHNRLLDISSARHPRAFLEIVAVDPSAAPPPRVRWFDLDAVPMQQSLAGGPRLVHWVARTTDIVAAAACLRAAGHDPGTPTAVERMSPRGLLRWHLTLTDDGSRPGSGAIPLLIAWGAEHPCDALPASGVALERIELGGVSAELAAALGADASSSAAGASPLTAILATSGGRIALVV